MTLPDPKAPPKTPPKKLPNLAQQDADFTAEGAPPPGKVATDVPVVPEKVPVTEADDPGIAAPPVPASPPLREKGGNKAKRTNTGS